MRCAGGKGEVFGRKGVLGSGGHAWKFSTFETISLLWEGVIFMTMTLSMRLESLGSCRGVRGKFVVVLLQVCYLILLLG